MAAGRSQLDELDEEGPAPTLHYGRRVLEGHRVVGPPAVDLRTTEIDGRLVVFNPANQQVLVLNETATAIWALADGSRDVTALVSALAAAYDADPATVEAGVHEALARFAQAGALEFADDGDRER